MRLSMVFSEVYIGKNALEECNISNELAKSIGKLGSTILLSTLCHLYIDNTSLVLFEFLYQHKILTVRKNKVLLQSKRVKWKKCKVTNQKYMRKRNRKKLIINKRENYVIWEQIKDHQSERKTLTFCNTCDNVAFLMELCN